MKVLCAGDKSDNDADNIRIVVISSLSLGSTLPGCHEIRPQ